MRVLLSNAHITISVLLFIIPVALAELPIRSASDASKRPGRGCPMSPYATYLTQDQQESLHELVVEARQQGADESTVKSHIDKYISNVLPPEKYAEFQDVFEQFEMNRRGKRSTEGKQIPRKVYDLLDEYSGTGRVDYSKFYEESVRSLKRD
ncbi:hypothetical protein Q1695_004598 [Nippostrongylus brasiliensis]|nr:hypothetical protein Q1695_004598 [Nippostrongylus brasiliensis]